MNNVQHENIDTIKRLGYYGGLTAAFFTISYCIVQVLQMTGTLKFPLDEILIYSTSLCIVVPYILTFVALHHFIRMEKRVWSHLAVIFCILYAVFVTANYVVQLATVLPLKIAGRTGEIGILEQTPHSMFWNFDALGYIFMGVATFCAIPIFSKKGIGKWLRFIFIAHALVTVLISIVYFYPQYSYRLLMIGFPWAVTAPASMIALALYFKRPLPELLKNEGNYDRKGG